VGDVAEGGAQQQRGQQPTQQLRENVAGHPAQWKSWRSANATVTMGFKCAPDTAPMNKMTVSTVKAGAVISAIRPIWPADRSCTAAAPAAANASRNVRRQFAKQPAPLVAQVGEVTGLFLQMFQAVRKRSRPVLLAGMGFRCLR
jgi:hypothetical protein